VSTAEYMLERAREIPAEGPVPSPCISVCRMNADTALCEGCFRTLDEIACWSMLPDAEKQAVWRQIEERAAAGASAA